MFYLAHLRVTKYYEDLSTPYYKSYEIDNYISINAIIS